MRTPSSQWSINASRAIATQSVFRFPAPAPRHRFTWPFVDHVLAALEVHARGREVVVPEHGHDSWNGRAVRCIMYSHLVGESALGGQLALEPGGLVGFTSSASAAAPPPCCRSAASRASAPRRPANPAAERGEFAGLHRESACARRKCLTSASVNDAFGASAGPGSPAAGRRPGRPDRSGRRLLRRRRRPSPAKGPLAGCASVRGGRGSGAPRQQQRGSGACVDSRPNAVGGTALRRTSAMEEAVGSLAGRAGRGNTRLRAGLSHRRYRRGLPGGGACPACESGGASESHSTRSCNPDTRRGGFGGGAGGWTRIRALLAQSGRVLGEENSEARANPRVLPEGGAAARSAPGGRGRRRVRLGHIRPSARRC